MATVLTLPTAITVAELDRWVAGADTGERLIFAQGETPPRDAPVWEHARGLQTDGVVRLHHVRGDGRQWQYIAIRQPPRVRDDPPPTPVVASSDPDDATEAVMRALRRAVNFERPCPSNVELARVCGLLDARGAPDPAKASYRLRLLRDTGRIKLVDYGPKLPRVVTIVASGRSSAAVTA